MSDRSDEQTVAEWMEWPVDPFGVAINRTRDVERKLAEAGYAGEYVSKLPVPHFGVAGSRTVDTANALMTATGAQRVKAAAETIRGMSK